ncbi:xaa-Pro aminopeptidase ApepP-like [Contarinia nasturtii]|uniref:xaa-Pro aminopeptidase ApepP-like n=1 Tax=Contarinia nasturtii TaxID=265458 RepID=UPI0012D41179|nr:xaa-Pro aminopeptidase ApepP-like [Contarinia nasturtii]XP_031619773.1 xaa-Pro aminopeptidase ApepP-like [Contarinia nasturtii]XP_031619774.1 xaa-Pro aminopeptidase ApepP-like [Contarinia nasturtii]
MSTTSNTKLILTGAALLIAIVSCSLAVARAITNDEISPEIDKGEPTSAKIVANIRKVMQDVNHVNTVLNAYIIPSVDAHQNENVADHDKRVQYVSGFTGIATIVITENKAVLWTDSRYIQLAKKQLDKETWTVMEVGNQDIQTIAEWLSKELPQSSRVGIDSFLIEAKAFHSLHDYLSANGDHSLLVEKNLVDVVWDGQPDYKKPALEPIDPNSSGEIIKTKLERVRTKIEAKKAEMLIVTNLEDIAWFLNLRGGDIDYSAVFFSYLIIFNDIKIKPQLFLLDKERAKAHKIDNHFNTEHVDIAIEEYASNEIIVGISKALRNINERGKVILSSPSKAIHSTIQESRRIEAESPIRSMRIIKNEKEIKGMREAHERDGVAIVRYLHELDKGIDDQFITETEGTKLLDKFKSHEMYRKLSYPPISAVGAHAAIAKAAIRDQYDSQITRQEIYLIDSGTHYKDGTTEMARTVHFGRPTPDEKNAFTRVLKGFISVATAVFPPNAPFSFFDAMARRSLWEIGKDYDHATGHGVGTYLNVFENPPLLTSKNEPPGMCENMFTTNEPGYYEAEKFGIRIGNVLQVVKVPNSSEYFNKNGAYMFEDFTMVPIQTKMINVDLLSESEVEWLNKYHKRVFENIQKHLSDDSNIIAWLEKETKPISKKKEDCNEITTPESQVTTITPTEQ